MNLIAGLYKKERLALAARRALQRAGFKEMETTPSESDQR